MTAAAAPVPRLPLDGAWEVWYEDEEVARVAVRDHAFCHFGVEFRIDPDGRRLRLRSRLVFGKEAERTWDAPLGTTGVPVAVGETLRWLPAFCQWPPHLCVVALATRAIAGRRDGRSRSRSRPLFRNQNATARRN